MRSLFDLRRVFDPLADFLLPFVQIPSREIANFNIRNNKIMAPFFKVGTTDPIGFTGNYFFLNFKFACFYHIV